jgi:hypothetical protein
MALLRGDTMNWSNHFPFLTSGFGIKWMMKGGIIHLPIDIMGTLAGRSERRFVEQIQFISSNRSAVKINL